MSSGPPQGLSCWWACGLVKARVRAEGGGKSPPSFSFHLLKELWAQTHSHARLRAYFNFRKVHFMNQIVSVVIKNLVYGLIPLRLAPKSLRVSRSTWMCQGGFSLQKCPWPSCLCNLLPCRFPYIVMFILSLYLYLHFSFLSDWIGEEWRGRRRKLGVGKYGAGIMCLRQRPCNDLLLKSV